MREHAWTFVDVFRRKLDIRLKTALESTRSRASAAARERATIAARRPGDRYGIADHCTGVILDLPPRSSPRASLLASLTVVLLLGPAVAHAAPAFVVRDLDAVPTEEGGEATFLVSLGSKPAGSVILDVASSAPAEVTLVAEDPAPFTSTDWNEPRRYRAIGLDDEVEDGDAKVTITIKAAPGSDPAFLAAPAVTLTTENLDDERTLVFESNWVVCDGPQVEDIHDGSVIGLLYDTGLAQTNQLIDWDLDNPVQDDRVFAENSDGTYFRLRTLHVVLPHTYRKTLTEQETLTLQQSFSRAAHRVHTASRGMIELDFEQVVIPREFGPGSFVDAKPDVDGFQADFVDYATLAWQLLLAGHVYDDYDMISLSIAFADDDKVMRTEIAYAVPPPDFKAPFTNPKTWNNDRTMSQLMFTTDPESAGWIDIYVHEMTHTLEWMHEYGSFHEMRNPDDPWWLFTYDDVQDVLDMFWARAKTDYFFIPPPWGSLHKRTPTHIVEMSCPTKAVYQERRVYCPNGVICGIGCWCDPEAPKPR